MFTKALCAISSVILFSLATAAARAQQIESIGAEKCGGPVQRHEVEFLAPETAQVVVVAKVLRDGKADQTSASILIDGKPCTGSECGFRAEKGRTYGLRAETPAEGFDNICISVGRP